MDQTPKREVAQFQSSDDCDIPSGPQNISIIDAGSGTLQIPGCTGDSFNVFFIYEYGQAPATVVEVFMNGQNEAIQPGCYQWDISTMLWVQYQVDPGQNIKLGWIYT